MKNTSKFKLGDKIIDFGTVYKIFKINKKKDKDGKTQKVMYFKPYFKNRLNKSIICSIPVKNVERNDIRKPISKKLLNKLYKKLKKKIKVNSFPNISNIKSMFNSNNPHKMVRVLKILSEEKKEREKGLSRSKKEIYDKVLKSLAQEFAFVGKASLEKTEEKIKKALGEQIGKKKN